MKALFCWTDLDIPNLWVKCIESFAANGFETIVYSLEPKKQKERFSSEIQCLDSNQILSIELLDRIKQKGRKGPCYQAFCDLFRAKALALNPGSWWFDTDVLCLKEKEHFENLIKKAEGKIIAGICGEKMINNAVLFSAENNKLISNYTSELFELAERNNYIGEWGDYGPSFLNAYAAKYPDHIMLEKQNTFYAINPSQTSYFYDEKYKEESMKILENSVCTHIWNECLKMAAIPTNMMPPQTSLLYELITKTTEIDHSILMPEETAIKLLYPPKIGLKKTLYNLFPALMKYIKRTFKK